MGIVNHFRFCIDNLIKYRIKILLVIVLQTLIYVLAGQVINEYARQRVINNECQSIFAYDLNKCEAVDIFGVDISDSAGNEKIQAFNKALYSLNGVAAIGNGCCGIFGTNGNDWFDGKIIRIQQSNPIKDRSSLYIGDSLRVRDIQLSFLPFYDFSYYDKISISDTQPEDTIYLILGNSFKNIKAGSTWSKELKDGRIIYYEVIGILEENEQFVETSVVDPEETVIYDLSYEVFRICPMVEEDYLNNRIVYAVDEKSSVSDIHNAIVELANQYGINENRLSFRNIGKSMDVEWEYLKYTLNIYIEVMVFALVVSLFISISVQTGIILEMRYQYAIMYANGAGSSDILSIVFMENTFLNIVAVVIAMAIIRCAYVRCAILLVIFSIIVAIISAIIPQIIILRNPPAKLIKEIMQ